MEMTRLSQNDNDQYQSVLPEDLVLIVMTGGTISMQKSPTGYVPATGFQEECLTELPLFNDGSPPTMIDVVINKNGDIQAYSSLRTSPSAYQRKIRYTVFEFDDLLDSCSVGSKEWTTIAETVFRNYHLFDGFVILHGTDTLAYTSSALSFMFQNLGKPVILTGAQTPMRKLQSDAIQNLLGSLVIAGHFKIPEVCLYFNNRLLRGNRTTKISASDYAAFDSPNYPSLAITSSSRTNVLWDLIQLPAKNNMISLQKVIDTRQVACLRLFPGIRPEMISAVLNLDGLLGLVLETFGPGSAPLGPDGDFINLLTHATKKGLLIISISQCLTGSVNPIYDSVASLSEAGIVAGLDMTTEAALTKMAWLFAEPNATSKSVAAGMIKSMRGELTESSPPIFEHPKATPPNNATIFSDLCYAISGGNVEQFEAIFDGVDQFLLEYSDYMGNTLLHVAAVSAHIVFLEKVLSAGGSPNMHNQAGNTPLFLAAKLELNQHVVVLLKFGAHLRPDEQVAAKIMFPCRSYIWNTA